MILRGNAFETPHRSHKASNDEKKMSHEDSEDLVRNVTLLDSTHREEDEGGYDSPVTSRQHGFHYRPPPPPHRLTSHLTQEDDLFQTIHMGPITVDKDRWKLTIDGLVERPFSIAWSQLMTLPKESVTAFHECYGSPIKPPVENLWRIGNVIWSGVSLRNLITLAKPRAGVQYVWSDGLDNGSFAGVEADRYQKDMPLEKAMMDGTLVAYEMNGEPLSDKRGGPVRLVVPGWYGTNSTKWLCRISLQNRRSEGPFTTTFYNEIDPTDIQKKRKRPCWEVEPNAFLLTTPVLGGFVKGPKVTVAGRAWSAFGIEKVSICVRRQNEWIEEALIRLSTRKQYEWQNFEGTIHLGPGEYELMARACDKIGVAQPLVGRRNHVHTLTIRVR